MENLEALQQDIIDTIDSVERIEKKGNEGFTFNAAIREAFDDFEGFNVFGEQSGGLLFIIKHPKTKEDVTLFMAKCEQLSEDFPGAEFTGTMVGVIQHHKHGPFSLYEEWRDGHATNGYVAIKGEWHRD